jgi:hypothetical protein
MSKLVMGLLLLVVLVLCFLLFWMVTLGFALLFFRKKGNMDKERLTEGLGSL